MNAHDKTLRLCNVTRTFGTPAGPLEILKGISLEVPSGQTVAVTGPSGSGKSTLLNIVGSLDKPTAGSVTLGDTDIVALQGRALSAFRSLQVGFVFQEHHLLDQLTARENVLLPTLVKPADDASVKLADELLEAMGVADRAQAFPWQLSGGERQRIAVARAMINRPNLLLCDEPTGNLDHDTGLSIVEVFIELSSERGVTVIMVTHNLEMAALFSRRLELKEGQLIELSVQNASAGDRA